MSDNSRNVSQESIGRQVIVAINNLAAAFAAGGGGGSGTVTSVGLTSTDLSVSGSPVTTSGSITANLTTTGVSAGSYGASNAIPVLTTDTKGRLTAVSTATPIQPLTATVAVLTAAGPYSVSSTDYAVIVNQTVAAPMSITLPSTPATGRLVLIKDGKGDASTNNITISPTSGVIDGAPSYILAANYGAAQFVYNGSSWSAF